MTPRFRALLASAVLALSPPAGAAEPEETFVAALAAWHAGRPAEARDLLNQLSEVTPDRAGVWFWLARSAREADDPATAARAVARAIELDTSSPDAWYLGGHIAAEAGDRATSEARFEQVIVLQPTGALGGAARSHLRDLRWLDDRDRAVALAEAGAEVEARELLLVLDAARPGDPTVAWSLGQLAWHRGEVAEALARFEAVLLARPEDRRARYWRAMALRRLGRHLEAREALSELASDPDPAVAGAARDALERDPRPTGAGWRLAAGAALDTNPAFVSEAARATEPATRLGWAASAEAGVPLVRWARTDLDVGFTGSVRDYVDGAEASWRGHGLVVDLRAEPWSDRLELRASGEFQWRRYDAPEEVTYEVGGDSLADAEERSDEWLFVSAAAFTRLRGTTWLFARYTGVINDSTLVADAWPVDRSYSRHLVLAGAEVRR